MRCGPLLCLPFLAACPSPPPSPNVRPDGGYSGMCTAHTPGAALYSGECQPPQESTFCLFAMDTNF